MTHSTMTRVLTELIELLSLERIETNLFRGQSQDPVSYTHLTLPTICSV